jgi:membrane protease YdiL (CAAX protease family)
MATDSYPSARPGTFAAWIAHQPLLAYFLLALLGTWLIVWPVALAGGEYGLGVLPFTVPEGVDFLLVQLSAYTGPLLAAFLVTRAVDGPEGTRALRRRIVQWRVAPRWYAVAIVLPLLIWLAAYGGALTGDPLSALAEDPAVLLTTFLPLVLIGLILPSLGEETGWRGFALPRLQSLHGPFVATLILGAFHGAWHLPAFWTGALGGFSVTTFVTFMLTAIAATFIYTWVFNNTGGSILLAMFLHASGNAASGLLNQLIPEDEEYSGWTALLVDDGWINVIAFGTVAIALIVVTRGRLGYRDVSEI